jgi:hypothetical protein
MRGETGSPCWDGHMRCRAEIVIPAVLGLKAVAGSLSWVKPPERPG